MNPFETIGYDVCKIIYTQSVINDINNRIRFSHICRFTRDVVRRAEWENYVNHSLDSRSIKYFQNHAEALVIAEFRYGVFPYCINEFIIGNELYSNLSVARMIFMIVKGFRMYYVSKWVLDKYNMEFKSLPKNVDIQVQGYRNHPWKAGFDKNCVALLTLKLLYMSRRIDYYIEFTNDEQINIHSAVQRSEIPDIVPYSLIYIGMFNDYRNIQEIVDACVDGVRAQLSTIADDDTPLSRFMLMRFNDN
jgi:hypothetical protein